MYNSIKINNFLQKSERFLKYRKKEKVVEK